MANGESAKIYDVTVKGADGKFHLSGPSVVSGTNQIQVAYGPARIRLRLDVKGGEFVPIKSGEYVEWKGLRPLEPAVSLLGSGQLQISCSNENTSQDLHAFRFRFKVEIDGVPYFPDPSIVNEPKEGPGEPAKPPT